jgi:hypothetical protein
MFSHEAVDCRGFRTESSGMFHVEPGGWVYRASAHGCVSRETLVMSVGPGFSLGS